MLATLAEEKHDDWQESHLEVSSPIASIILPVSSDPLLCDLVEPANDGDVNYYDDHDDGICDDGNDDDNVWC